MAYSPVKKKKKKIVKKELKPTKKAVKKYSRPKRGKVSHFHTAAINKLVKDGGYGSDVTGGNGGGGQIVYRDPSQQALAGRGEKEKPGEEVKKNGKEQPPKKQPKP